MLRIGRRLSATPLFFISASSFAQSDAYRAGYSFGQQVGRFIGPALPALAIAIAIVIAWLAYRAWRKRRDIDDRQA